MAGLPGKARPRFHSRKARTAADGGQLRSGQSALWQDDGGVETLKILGNVTLEDTANF